MFRHYTKLISNNAVKPRFTAVVSTKNILMVL